MMPIFNEIVEMHTKVYRNIIGMQDGFDEFDDLSSDADTKKYAHQLTNTFNKQDSHYHAIDYIFQQSTWLPTRYGTGQYPVWYASVDLITSFYETFFHWQRTYLKNPHFKNMAQNIKTMRMVYHVECKAALIDLRNKAKEYPILIHPDPERYEITQKWGIRMHKEGYPGLLAPSARKLDGENVAIFKKNILTNAEHYQDFLYEYDIKSQKVFIKTSDGSNTYFIID